MAHARHQIFIKIEKILRDLCNISGPIYEESIFTDDLLLDSLGALTLSAAIEDQFGFDLNDGLTVPPLTVGELIDVIEQKQKTMAN